MIALLALLALLACPGSGPTGSDPCGAGAPTWDSFAQGYVRTWCTPCHSASLEGPQRQGAPTGIDLDHYSDVIALADRIEARATGPDADMPPLGGVEPDAVERLGAWLACGAPGSDPPPDPCDQPIEGPAATVASQADADALCAGSSAVRGLTVTGDAALGCLCVVSGPLTIEGGAVSLPALEEVTGTISALGGAASLSAPRLEQIGGSLRLGGAVHTVSLPRLEQVSGEVVIEGAVALRALALDTLSQASALRVRDDPVLASLSLARLAEVSGDVVIEALPALVALERTRSLRTVGGDLVLAELERLAGLDTWALQFLATVDGSVRIEGNAALRNVGGFTLLQSVGGDLVVADNASLRGIDGLDNLRTVGGDLVLADNPLQETVAGLDNLDRVSGAVVLDALPSLRSLAGPVALRRAGALTVSHTGPVTLPWLTALEPVDGVVRLEGNASLRSIDGLSALGSVGGLVIAEHPVLVSLDGLAALTWVGGDLVLERNTTLATVAPLHGIEAVDGGLTVRDNPTLPTAGIDAWIEAIGTDDIAGPITVEGNG